MKLTIVLYIFFNLGFLLPIAKTAPIFGLWGTGKPDDNDMAMGADYVTFTLAEAPKLPAQDTGSLLSRFPIFDTLLPWGITKTEIPQDIGSMSKALPEPEKEVFVRIVQDEAENSGVRNSAEGDGWKSIFGRLWSWAKALFKSLGHRNMQQK